MAMNGSFASHQSFQRVDNINGGKKDHLVSKKDVTTAYDKATGDDKKHLKKVLDGFDKAPKAQKDQNGKKLDNKNLMDQNAFGTLYG